MNLHIQDGLPNAGRLVQATKKSHPSRRRDGSMKRGGIDPEAQPIGQKYGQPCSISHFRHSW